MKKTALIGAAFALLMSSAAFGQQPPAPPAPLDSPPPVLAPEALAPEPEGDATAGAGMNEPSTAGEMRGPRHMRSGRGGRNWRDHHAGMHHGWRDDHMGGPGWRAGRRDGDGGAFFRFRSDNGPTIAIECADRDSTLECVNAIMPMLQRMLPDQGQPVPQ